MAGIPRLIKNKNPVGTDYKEFSTFSIENPNFILPQNSRFKMPNYPIHEPEWENLDFTSR